MYWDIYEWAYAQLKHKMTRQLYKQGLHPNHEIVAFISTKDSEEETFVSTDNYQNISWDLAEEHC